MKIYSALLAAAICLLLTGCNKPQAAAAAPPYKPVATLEQVMHGMVIPNAEVVWDAVGYISDLKGSTEIKPAGEDDWIRIEASAITLTEAGNLLMMSGRAKDSDKWMERCRALIDAGSSVLKAAQARNPEDLFTRGGDLFEACQQCHFQYRFTMKDPNTFRSH